jgi:hypothetical protein
MGSDETLKNKLCGNCIPTFDARENHYLPEYSHLFPLLDIPQLNKKDKMWRNKGNAAITMCSCKGKNISFNFIQTAGGKPIIVICDYKAAELTSPNATKKQGERRYAKTR